MVAILAKISDVQDALELMSSEMHGYEHELPFKIHRKEAANSTALECIYIDEVLLATVEVGTPNEVILSHIRTHVNAYYAGERAGQKETKNAIKDLLDIEY